MGHFIIKIRHIWNDKRGMSIHRLPARNKTSILKLACYNYVYKLREEQS